MQADVYGIKEMQKALNSIEPKLANQMQRDAKAIAKPGADKVKAEIPSVAPLPGMLNQGRLGWDVGVRANKVTVRYSTRRSRVAKVTSLVSIRVDSPVAAMIDVAGKGKGASTRKRSAAGVVMIAKLHEKGVSNFAWPAVEQEIPSMEREIRLVIGKYADRLNRELR